MMALLFLDKNVSFRYKMVSQDTKVDVIT